MSKDIACVNMIKQQLRTGNVLNETILELYTSLPREDFVPMAYKSFAYSDMQIPLPHGQRMMTPLEEATLLQALRLKGNEIVLEIGTGTGFLTALLSRLCQKVVSVDCFAEFTTAAHQKLNSYSLDNIECITGNGARGWLDKAPYDVILFTAPLETLTDTHRLQVIPGGKLFAILGKAPIMQAQLHQLTLNGEWQKELLFETCLPPMSDGLKTEEFVF